MLFYLLINYYRLYLDVYYSIIKKECIKENLRRNLTKLFSTRTL